MDVMAELTSQREQRARPLVLIVEDQLDLRQLYAQELVLSGFDVIEAGNGVDAISHTSAQFPDVVLMDLSLPVLDGWEATRRLKDDTRTAHIPVVALTAHDGSGELQRATRAGCDWFVPSAPRTVGPAGDAKGVTAVPRSGFPVPGSCSGFGSEFWVPGSGFREPEPRTLNREP
jgi:CheY-like chemotaxis protein